MKVAAFYRFLDIDDPEALRQGLLAQCRRRQVLGTVLLADEGFNGTLCGAAGDVEARWTDAETAPFRRLRVKTKKEIVTLGRPDIRPHERTGTYVEPSGWNALIDDPDVLVVDTRNRYEFEVGTFPGAVDPGTDRFRDFPAFAEKIAAESSGRRVAMFCTGGIRCEKATALMLELGFDEVYHLRGGILNYLQQVPPEDSRWRGECFVFDTRVALDRDLSEGGYEQCHACRRPLSSADLASPDYREGVSCPKCVDGLDDARAARLEERRRQVELARRRGDAHIGPREES